MNLVLKFYRRTVHTLKFVVKFRYFNVHSTTTHKTTNGIYTVILRMKQLSASLHSLHNAPQLLTVYDTVTSVNHIFCVMSTQTKKYCIKVDHSA
jgi:hypothetical protein